MQTLFNRRTLIQTGSALGAAQLGLLGKLPRVSADEAKPKPDLVSLESGIEPLVRLIETTEKSELIEVIAARVSRGLSYQHVLAALFLAGVRNIQPRPSVGFKFHSVLVVNSAHLASMASADADRWLPIFWALDYFKSTQSEEESKTGWKMRPVDESRVPSASKARADFVDAMENWDEEAADAAVASLARSAGANELFELFCRYGARDFRSIGHKAIYVANSFRTLQCIGWQHAEPVLRSLAYALQNHSGEGNPAKSDYEADRAWRQNLDIESKIPDEWQAGKLSQQATRELIDSFRAGAAGDMSELAVSMLQRGISPQSVWDGVLLGSGELLMRQPGIVGIHTLTTANALHYAYQTSADDQTRRMLLLQACAFLPMFRASASDRGKLSDHTLETLTTAGQERSSGEDDDIQQIFDKVSTNRMQAAESLYRYMQSGGSADDVLGEARRLIFLKGRDAHDYKFSSAVLEDFAHVSPPLKSEFLALSVFNLRGARDRDNELVSRIREAL